MATLVMKLKESYQWLTEYLILVDAYEGCYASNKIRSLESFRTKSKPIVVVNKIDKPEARVDAVMEEVFELLLQLGADDSILDFPIVYTSAVNGESGLSLDTQ